MAHTFTTADLYALLKPYENYTLTPRKWGEAQTYVDIATLGVNRIGACIRDVTPEGIKVFSYRDCEFVPFEKIERVTIRTADLYNTLSKTEYRREVAAMGAAA